LICIPLAFYYSSANIFLNEAGVPRAAAIMTLGQVSEVVFMLLLPLFLKKFGVKTTLIVGMLAWVLRYVLFAFGDGDSGTGIGMLVTGIILHGICYDFFFVSGQIYTDYKAGHKIKNAAQGLITLATYGVGMLIGFRLGGMIVENYALTESGHEWFMIWVIPACIAAAIALLFLVSFKNEKIEMA
jgi:MFS family permease